MDRNKWDAKLSAIAAEYKFNHGYKILYNRWSVIGQATVAFMSLNPGREGNADLAWMISDERGSSHLVEKHTSISPINRQVLALYEFLDIDPSTVLDGVLHPFRSDEWNNFSAAQKNAGLEIGKKFWREAIDGKIEKLIVSGKQIKPHVLSMTGAQIDAVIPSGWGEQTLERYTTATGMEIFIMPHLSRFKLFTRPECRGPLIAFFKI